MKTTPLTRREFMERSLAWAGAAALAPAVGAAGAGGEARTAVDRVTLGRSGLRPTRLGMGTGVRSGADQVALGKPGFTRLIHEAYDRGIRYFDCAQMYQTFPWMAEALDGLPREDLFILSKVWDVPENPAQVIDDHLRNFKTDYIDCLLLHCTTSPDWVDERRTVVEAMQQAKAAGRSGPSGCPAIACRRYGWPPGWISSTSTWSGSIRRGSSLTAIRGRPATSRARSNRSWPRSGG